MKEDYSTRIAKKIRNKLIYYSYLDLKKKLIKKNCLLINSMTPNELNDKYQKCSDYCVEKIETYTSSQNNNGIDNNNYFHVSVTYCSLNNNYHMLVDNKNVDQYIGQNNIIGKYYKGNTLQIRTTTDKLKYNIYLNENKLEKKIIGENKFKKKHRSIASSLEVNKKINFIDNENINEVNGLKSINNAQNIKKLINDKINNEKIQTNCGNKIRKTNSQKILNKHMLKLKNYCANLIKIEKKVILKDTIQNNNKEVVLFSPINEKRKKNRIDKNHFRSGKEKPKFEARVQIMHDSDNFDRNLLNSSNINPKLHPDIKNYPIHTKLKSQTKIYQNLFKLQAKRSFHRKNKSIDKFEEEKSISPKKNSPRKIFSPKKSSPKKIISPKKVSVNEFNSGPGVSISKFFNLYQKFNKKDKINEVVNIKKYTSGNKIDYPLNKRKTNNNTIGYNNNGNPKLNSNNTEKTNSNLFRSNNNNMIKKGRLKKSLTINKMIKFRAGEILEKKIGIIKLKNGKY